jgi:hypothetical protein
MDKILHMFIKNEKHSFIESVLWNELGLSHDEWGPHFLPRDKDRKNIGLHVRENVEE